MVKSFRGSSIWKLDDHGTWSSMSASSMTPWGVTLSDLHLNVKEKGVTGE